MDNPHSKEQKSDLHWVKKMTQKTFKVSGSRKLRKRWCRVCCPHLRCPLTFDHGKVAGETYIKHWVGQLWYSSFLQPLNSPQPTSNNQHESLRCNFHYRLCGCCSGIFHILLLQIIYIYLKYINLRIIYFSTELRKIFDVKELV